MENLARERREKLGGHRSVTVYEHGALVHDWREKVNVSSHSRAKRGEIKGWSPASRRRMREFMLTHQPPKDWELLGATLTLPPNVPHEKEKDIFYLFGRKIQKSGFGMVWRMESQRRGALHWHCIITVPVTSEDKHFRQHFAGDGYNEFRSVTSGKIEDLWHDSLEIGGFLTVDAIKYSADVRGGGGDDRWLRYMQDHASKSKQYQVASGRGRHWGIVGREVFCKASGLSLSFPLDRQGDKEFSVFLRYLRRWSTPLVRCDSDPLGYRLGYTCKRGHWGKSVWFRSPLALGRLLSYSKGRMPDSVGNREKFFSSKGGLNAV